MHDLRRSFGSWLGAAGVAPKLIGTMLGHKTDITSRVYVQLGEAAGIKREVATAHAKLAEEFRQDKPRAEVVNITARNKA
jgi:integrase